MVVDIDGFICVGDTKKQYLIFNFLSTPVFKERQKRKL